MVYEVVVTYGIISMLLGIVPAIVFAIWRFGFNKRLWFAWLLGGLFWLLALLARSYPLILIIANPELIPYSLLIQTLFAGVFETIFRVLVLLFLTKFTADTTEKVMMTGLGWGTIEAIIVHTIPVLNFISLPPDNEAILQFDGIEYIILFGGYERIITEVFHLIMLILVFYGIKHKLKGIEVSEPTEQNFFAADPKPVWIWVVIVATMHFAWDFIIVSLFYSAGYFAMYTTGTVWVAILIWYTWNRSKSYPLFP